MHQFNFQDVLLEYDILPSTNSTAIELIETSKNGECFIVKANAQTQGKGRLKRKWVSERGNIYITLSIKDYFIPLNISSILPLYVSFIILKKLEKYDIQYKWPNDLLIKGEKFCGILIQKFKGFFIIGIGVNTNSAPKGATYLLKYGISISIEEIFQSFQEHLFIEANTILEYLKERFFKKREININKGEFIGDFYDITPKGELILKFPDGILKSISYGDIGIEI